MTQKEYVLGTDREELDRLELQHELWKTELIDLWSRAKLGDRQNLVDLGCGPGFTTLELAKFLGPKKKVTALDISESFLNHLKSVPPRSENAKIETRVTNLESPDLETNFFDGANCRWLMIFLKNPEAAIQKIAQSLKSGSPFVLQEYVAYSTMSLYPRPAIMDKIVSVIYKSWKDQGGDPDRGQILPELLEKNGFKVTWIESVSRTTRPGEALWQWPDTFYKSFLPRMVKTGYLKQNEFDEFFKYWNSASQEKGAFYLIPTLINIIAVKK